MRRFPGWVVLGSVFAVVAATPVGAFEHPQVDRGFDPDKLFQFGEVDHVSLRDGKVSVLIPIGQEFPLSERFGYRFQAAWSGSVWDFFTVGGPSPGVMSVPNRLSNAGWSWAVYLAQLRAPGDPSGATTWRFYGPDGGEEEINYGTLHFCEGLPAPNGCGSEQDTDAEYSYSRSGSYIRMYAPDADLNYREVHLRDGAVYEFEKVATKWRLSRIRDQFLSGGAPQNWVEIDYTSEFPNWRIEDNLGRVHRVIFSDRLYDGVSLPMVDEIQLASFGTGTATYDFRYFDDPGEPTTLVGQRRDLRHTTGTPPRETEFTVARLSSIVLPDSTRWTFDYFNDNPGTYWRRGQMSTLGYPTHGRIRYEYFRQTMAGAEPCPSDDWLDNYDLLLWKRILDEDGVVNASDGEYTYVYELSNYDYPAPVDPNPCGIDLTWPKEQLLVRTITPNKDRIENFFSIWSHQEWPSPGRVDTKMSPSWAGSGVSDGEEESV